MVKILAIMPSGRAQVYKSLRAASRQLSGDGSDRRRSYISSKSITPTGGYVGNVYVQDTILESVTRR